MSILSSLPSKITAHQSIDNVPAQKHENKRRKTQSVTINNNLLALLLCMSLGDRESENCIKKKIYERFFLNYFCQKVVTLFDTFKRIPQSSQR